MCTESLGLKLTSFLQSKIQKRKCFSIWSHYLVSWGKMSPLTSKTRSGQPQLYLIISPLSPRQPDESPLLILEFSDLFRLVSRSSFRLSRSLSKRKGANKVWGATKDQFDNLLSSTVCKTFSLSSHPFFEWPQSRWKRTNWSPHTRHTTHGHNTQEIGGV